MVKKVKNFKNSPRRMTSRGRLLIKDRNRKKVSQSNEKRGGFK